MCDRRHTSVSDAVMRARKESGDVTIGIVGGVSSCLQRSCVQSGVLALQSEAGALMSSQEKDVSTARNLYRRQRRRLADLAGLSSAWFKRGFCIHRKPMFTRLRKQTHRGRSISESSSDDEPRGLRSRISVCSTCESESMVGFESATSGSASVLPQDPIGESHAADSGASSEYLRPVILSLLAFCSLTGVFVCLAWLAIPSCASGGAGCEAELLGVAEDVDSSDMLSVKNEELPLIRRLCCAIFIALFGFWAGVGAGTCHPARSALFLGM